MQRLLFIILVGLIPFVVAGAPEQNVDFKRDVEPIFAANCISCHGAKVALSGLRLDVKAEALKVITPGNSAKSSLIGRVTGEIEPRMPMGKAPLSAAQIGILRTWVDQGAQWPEEATSTATPQAKHWSFIAV